MNSASVDSFDLHGRWFASESILSFFLFLVCLSSFYTFLAACGLVKHSGLFTPENADDDAERNSEQLETAGSMIYGHDYESNPQLWEETSALISEERLDWTNKKCLHRVLALKYAYEVLVRSRTSCIACQTGLVAQHWLVWKPRTLRSYL